MNSKQQATRASRIIEKIIEKRKELWPKVGDAVLWHRKRNDGFTTIPRPMPIITQIIDQLATKSKPVSQVYLSLWFRMSDPSLIEIKNERELAFEGGFSGQRAITTWHSRMKNLIGLGFIDAKPGAAGQYQYVLVYNPYIVLKKYKKEIPEQLYNALFARAQEVGASSDFQ